MSSPGKRGLDDETEQKPRKKAKLSDDSSEIKSPDKDVKEIIHDFKLDRVLNNNPQSKTICLLGHCGDDASKAAMILLEKTPFSKDSVKEMLADSLEVDVILRNDVYNSLKIFPPPSCSELRSTLIYPATSRHVDKYKAHSKLLFTETPEDYQAVTLPYIESAGFNVKWVYNILEKKSESERIVFEDPDPKTGFVLLPDLKWDTSHLENLYLVAIVHDRSLRSIRDLNQQHLELLKNIQDKGATAIAEKYGVKKNRLRIFFHYQPSYYHLHVHFTHLGFEAPGIDAGKAHLLCDVINNIELAGDWYQKKTFSFYYNSSAELAVRFKQHHKLTE